MASKQNIHHQFEFLFVGRQDGTFLENYSYDLGEGDEDAGRLFVTCEIQNNPADAEVIAETIFDAAKKIFFADLEKDLYSRFEESLKEVNRAINDFKEETVSKFVGNLNVVIAVIKGAEMHLSQTGDAEAYLVRKKFCSVITEGLFDPMDESGETFANIASGSLEPGDFIMFSTTRLLRYISKTDFINVLQSKNLIGSLDTLKDALSTEILGRIAVIGISVHEGLSELSDNERGEVSAYLREEKDEPILKRTKKRIKSFKGISLGGFFERITDSIIGFHSDITSKRMSKDKLLVLLIIIILVLTGLIWGVKNRGATQRELERLDEVLVEVQEEINAAHIKKLSSKKDAAVLLLDAEQKAVNVLNSGYYRSKATELLGLVQEERKNLDNITYVEPKVVADLSNKRDNISLLGLIPYKDGIFAYEYNALYKILLDQVDDPLTIDENEYVIGATYDDDNDVLLFITRSGKVIQYAKGQFEFMDADEGEFRKGVAVTAYNRRMYILDAEAGQVWRYSIVRDKYAIPEGYIASGDITNPVDITIDGFVYVLLGDGTIRKFDRGNQVDFEIAKPPLDPLEEPTRIYTEIDLNKIYVLEPAKNRVVVLSKDDDVGGASYDSQYVFENITTLRDLYFDKSNNKLYVIDDTKLYEVDI